MEEENVRGEKIKALIGITRPVNWLIAGIGVIAGCLAGVGLNPTFASSILLAFFSTVLMMAGGNSLDYLDRNIDAVVRGRRSFPPGKLHPSTAFHFAVVSFIVGIILAFFINLECFIIALFNLLIIIAYEISLKKRGFVGNVATGYLVGSVFWFGGASVGEIFVIEIIFMAVLAGLVSIGREILKDILGIVGDKGVRETLPMRIGKKNARIISASFIGLATVLSFFTLFWGILGESKYTYVFLAVPNALFIVISVLLISRCNALEVSSKLLKAGMVIALIPFILGGVLR